MSNVLGKTREMDMCTGPLFKKILVFTFPIMLSNLLQILFNMADSVVVSRFSSDGSDALAAVGTTTSIIYLVINLAIGLSVGTNVLVSRYYGAKDYRRLGDAVHTSVFISLFTGLLCSVIGIFLTPALLRIVGAPEDILPLAAKYMKIYFAGFTAVSVYNFGSAILRAVGDTQRPLLYMLISGILNVTLNLFFVIVLDMSVDGVALATVISQGVAAVMVLITLMRTDSCYKLELKKIRCDWKSLKQIAIVGIPAGIQSSLFSISNAMVQSSINSFGKAVTAGNTAACNVENISYTALNSIQFAALAFTSQNIGAGKTDMVKKVLQKCIILNLILGVMIFTLVSLTGEYLLRIYDVQDPAILDAALTRFRYVTSLGMFCSLMEIFAAMLRGFGYSIQPMIVTLIGSCALRILWLEFILPLNHTLDMVFIIYPISWVMTTIAHIICYQIAYRKLKRQLTPAAA